MHGGIRYPDAEEGTASPDLLRAAYAVKYGLPEVAPGAVIPPTRYWRVEPRG